VSFRSEADALPQSALNATSESCCDLVDRHFSSRRGHHELIGRVIGRIEVDVVQAVEDDAGKQPRRLLPSTSAGLPTRESSSAAALRSKSG
jgi:hypothetical protein